MSKKVLMRKNGYKLIGKVVKNGAMQRVSVMVYQINKAGEISVPSTLQRLELLKRSKPLQDLLNLSICLTEEELNEVIEKAIAMLAEPENIAEAENIDEKSTPRQLYEAICDYGKQLTSNPIIPETEEEPKQMIWLDKDFLNIRTSDFSDFLKDIPEADEYKKTEVLKCLKLLGVLETDAGRAYDKKISKDGQKINCYRIQMPATKTKTPKEEKINAVEIVGEIKPAEPQPSEPQPSEPKPAEVNDRVQMTVEEIIAETDAKAESILQETHQPKPSSSEKEKLQKAAKEMFADENKIEIVPTVSKNEKPINEESVDDWYKQFQ